MRKKKKKKKDQEKEEEMEVVEVEGEIKTEFYVRIPFVPRSQHISSLFQNPPINAG
jgi:hypothetical protein